MGVNTVSLHEKPKTLDELLAALVLQASEERRGVITLSFDPNHIQRMKFTSNVPMADVVDIFRAIVGEFDVGNAKLVETKRINGMPTRRKQCN